MKNVQFLGGNFPFLSKNKTSKRFWWKILDFFVGRGGEGKRPSFFFGVGWGGEGEGKCQPDLVVCGKSGLEIRGVTSGCSPVHLLN